MSNLTNVPEVPFLNILFYLPKEDKKNLRRVCKWLYQQVTDLEDYFRIYFVDLGKINLNQLNFPYEISYEPDISISLPRTPLTENDFSEISNYLYIYRDRLVGLQGACSAMENLYTLPNLMSLEKLEISSYYMEIEWLPNILQALSNLSTLILVCVKLSNLDEVEGNLNLKNIELIDCVGDPANILSTCSKSLHSMQMADLKLLNFTSLYGASKFSRLKDLKLSDDGYSEGHQMDLDLSEILRLCSNVKSVEFDSINLSSLEAINYKLPNLKKLKVYNCIGDRGLSNLLKMSCSSIRILHLKYMDLIYHGKDKFPNLKHLILYNCDNPVWVQLLNLCTDSLQVLEMQYVDLSHLQSMEKMKRMVKVYVWPEPSTQRLSVLKSKLTDDTGLEIGLVYHFKGHNYHGFKYN